MNKFRAAVAAFMNRSAPAPALIPAIESPDQSGTGSAPRPTLRRGSTGNFVKQAQEKLGVRPDGEFGAKTEVAVRNLQRASGMVPDGIIGPKTWAALDQPEPKLGAALAGTVETTAPSPARPRVGHHILGDLSAKYETGNRGPGTVSTGIGDPGGISYGSYQMTSKGGGTVKVFVSQTNFPWRNEFVGLTPGSDNFTRQWKKIADEEPDRFQDAQHGFIKKTHFDPLVAKVKEENKLDLTTRSFALQDVIWSTAVQQGPNTKVVSNALKTLKGIGTDSPDFDERLIKAIYDERGQKLPDGNLKYFWRCSKDVQKDVSNRFINERADALQMLANEN
ncbi:MAG: peptidoglycan-binding domain-containing protein [Methylococcaceae bacterium]